ncbi:FAD-binding oxidoreductase [Solirubrobacter phytolaccae]|uniref:FAD-binding oxidoreductase n=1 Tax=Solirubrobacter phytolaccae TaxID=1404360 RepID=A0A9X3SJM3_9ACTN|nr:FAD-binding oxidoreductase [Solirubrobacter phytolaccae]MDA0185417.1 FAD-binding oxidoreductase [Solirubrobacter phytolaccae]
MTMIDPVPALRDLCGGAVALPGDDGYDAARSGFNLALDQRPAAVAYPADAAEVAEVIHAAKAAGLRVAGQATGHNAAPLGDVSGTVLVKTSGMRRVEIDPAARIARTEAGALWEDVIDAAAPHGLIALHGSSPTVGVTGYSLGGGMGWLARSHGLQANSVTAIELVTADGQQVRTDAQHDPELFWALRGGGGNFGIVTALEFRLFPLREICAGFMLWDWTEAGRIVTAWSEWAKDAPDHVTTSLRIMQLPPLEELPEFLRGRRIVMIDGAVQGDPAVLDPLRALAPELDTFGTVPAPALARLHQDPEDPMPVMADTALIATLPAEAIAELIDLAGPGSGSSLDAVELRQCGGALRRATPGHGAAAGVNADFVLFMGGLVLSHEMAAEKKGRMLEIKAALAPWTNAGHYLNFAEDQVDMSETFSTDAWARLCDVKDRVDPENVIHANHAI